MATYSNTAREVEMPNGDVVVIHNAPTGGENTTSNIKKFKYDDNGHITESTAANAEDLNLSSYSTPTTGTTAIGTSDDVQTAIGKLDHQSHIDQTNILYAINRVGKNIFDITTPDSTRDTTVTPLENGGATISCTNASWTQYYKTLPTEIGKVYKVVLYIDSISGVSSNQFGVIFKQTNSSGTNYTEFGNLTATGTYEADFTATVDTLCVAIFLNNTTTAKTSSASIRLLICEKSVYDTVSSDYQPFALPNYDLTRLEAEDRAALAEVVDSGAKNVWNFPDASYESRNSLTVTDNSDGSKTFTAENGNWQRAIYKVNVPTTGRYCLAFSVKNSSLPSSECYIFATPNNSSSNNRYASIQITGNGNYTTEFNVTGDLYIWVYLNYGAGTEQNSITLYNVMICTKAAFGVSQKFVPFGTDPFYQVPINHNMIYRGRSLGATLTDAQHTALSSGNFTDLYLGDYWTKTVTIPAGTYTGGDGEEVTVPAQTNVTLKAVIADFDTFYAGYASSYAGINTHHVAVIVTGFSNVVWNKTNSTAGGYVASLIHKWLVGSALPQIETWFGSAKVLSHQKLLTNAITGDAASGWAWSSQKIALLSENQMYGSKVWGNSKAANGGYEPGEAFKHLNVFNHIDANLLFGNKNIWLRDIASAGRAAGLNDLGYAYIYDASYTGIAPAALILLS